MTQGRAFGHLGLMMGLLGLMLTTGGGGGMFLTAVIVWIIGAVFIFVEGSLEGRTSPGR